MSPARHNSGFTLVELLLVMAIISLLFTIGALLTMNLIPRASLTAQSEMFVAEMRHQQLKAMTGGTNSLGQSPGAFGVYITTSAYTLFSGATYDPLDGQNFTITLDEPTVFETTLPDQTVVYATGSGEVTNYQPEQNTVTIRDLLSNQSTTYILNKYGVISELP